MLHPFPAAFYQLKEKQLPKCAGQDNSLGRTSPAVRMTIKASGSKRPSSHVLSPSSQAQRHDGNTSSGERLHIVTAVFSGKRGLICLISCILNLINKSH
uniref:Uncharacterized protein n=1 Tax=Catharus ustulatus TaxID=91951 RepID=A0A8C3U6G1_CATUS